MLIQFGSLITQGAGKIGGHVVQRGSFGQIMRTKTQPVIRRSPSETVPRTIQSQIASTWRTMAITDRLTWGALAATLTRYNKFGTAYTPSGFQIFNEFNARSTFYYGLQYFSTAPTPNPFPALADWSLVPDAALDKLELKWKYLSGSADWSVFVSYYPLQSLGSAVPRGSYRRCAASALITAQSINLGTAFVKRFGSVASGLYQVAVEISIVDELSGAIAPRLFVMTPYV